MKEWKDSGKGKENRMNTRGGKGPKRPLGAYPQWLADNRAMLTEKVMKQHSVDKTKAFLMLYKEGKQFYDALPPAEKKKCEDQAAAAKVKFQADMKEWKENSKGGEVAAAEENAEDEDNEEGQPPQPKRARKGEKTAPAAKVRKSKVVENDDIDESVLSEARKLGWESALQNLARRPDVKEFGKTDMELLAAIKSSGGLVNSARHVLLGA